MANTTDLMITTLFDDQAITWINHLTGMDFKQVTDGGRSGGPKVLSFEAYGTCPKSLEPQQIKHLINAFKIASFKNPEYAVLFIDCDSNTQFNGIVTRN